MKLPAMLSAVQTTPPMTSAASMPPGPRSPTATITTLARISVISVIPLTGLLPTMAMALAATVVKRKAMMATSRMPTTAKGRLPCITPSQKKRNVMAMTAMLPMAMILNDMSRCVRFTAAVASPLPFISLAASPMAPLMMPQLLTMPMMPAMAMPPMPMLRA